MLVFEAVEGGVVGGVVVAPGDALLVDPDAGGALLVVRPAAGGLGELADLVARGAAIPSGAGSRTGRAEPVRSLAALSRWIRGIAAPRALTPSAVAIRPRRVLSLLDRLQHPGG